ncbi:MAG: DNA polymerase I, partial [Planctomycetota bacterium]|nr:DNA polymerase I [Planctomycetota bacterium]
MDTHSLLYQVFHALPEMTSPAGEPVQAVFGILRDVLRLLAAQKPDYLFAAVDLPGKTFRHEIYDRYKIHRSAMPDDLVSQIPIIHRVFDVLGVPVVSREGFEADDVLATIARRVEEDGGQCVLVTSDKDCRQLITDSVRVYSIRKNQMYDAAALAEDWGIRPDQVVDFQSLVGDSVDNVPGVPLIGPKIARELLGKYKTLEGVLDNAGEVSGNKRRQNLLEGRDVAMLSRRLVKLDANVEVLVDWATAEVRGVNRPALQEIFDEFGFRRLGDQLDALTGSSADEPAEVNAVYHLVDTPKALAELVDEMISQDRISIDTETTSVWPRWAEIVGYSFAWKDNEAWYVPVRAPAGEPCLNPDQTLAALRPVLEDADIEKVGQNLKYDMIVLRSARAQTDDESTGLSMAGLGFDSMLADYLLEAGERNHGMDDMARRYLNHTTTKIDALIGKGKNQKRMDEVPVAAVVDYAGEDALVPLLLRPILLEGLRDQGLEDLLVELELPLVDVLVEMEYNGIKVDRQRLAVLSKQYGERIETLKAEIHALAGREFNIASPKQLQEILFTEQGLSVIKKTKTGPSTDAEVLAELAKDHPLPAKIIEYRQYAKLKNTYVDALPEMIHPDTGRVHASFNQVVTATGRLSSSDPNLQNIPVRTNEGREIRSAFVPGEPGWVLLAADYSQIELRVLAHFSQDEQLSEAFANDEDIHARVAGLVNGVPPDEVTREMRRQAKAVNFGVIYGQSGFGLSKQLGIEREEAERFIDEYFAG